MSVKIFVFYTIQLTALAQLYSVKDENFYGHPLYTKSYQAFQSVKSFAANSSWAFLCIKHHQASSSIMKRSKATRASWLIQVEHSKASWASRLIQVERSNESSIIKHHHASSSITKRHLLSTSLRASCLIQFSILMYQAT